MLFTKDYSQLLLIPEGKEGAASLPDQTTLVPAAAFSRCSSLSRLLVGDSAMFTSYDGVLYSKDMKALVACPAGIGASIVIPAETETIDKDAFSGCKALASITALGNVQKIDPTAFSDETKATAVVALPAGQDYDSRKAAWEQAGFANFPEPAKPGETTNADTNEATSSLIYTLLDDYTLAVSWQGKDDPEANLEIPSSAEINGVPYRVSTIAENAFANRGSLTSVKLPSTITFINTAAFAGCANLATIEFPNTLRNIGERAFEATSLKDVWLPASINSIGSRAFASCSSLERVVALGTPEIATDALAGCTGVSIYVSSSSEDMWNPGIPSDNNHLLPYSVSLSEEPLTIEAGQEADLLEGGNLQAPDPVEVSYSYAASPVSIDAGRVSAKKAGTSDVTAVLFLDGIELTRATRTVEVSPNPLGEPDIAILNSEVPLPAAYLANARETQLNVTAPVDGAIFGKDIPYDVAATNPPASMESTVDFENNMDVPVYLAQVDCDNQDASTVLVGNSGATLVTNQKLFSLYPKGAEREAMHFGCDKDIKIAFPNNPSAFTIQPGVKSPFIFRLNLTNDPKLANAKVNEGVAKKKAEVHSLAKIMYTFEVASLGSGSGSDSPSSSFYLKDKTTNQVYTAAEVKEHANAIARGNKVIKAAYQKFMENENNYECKTVWGGIPYDVRIIGINHDDLTTQVDGRTKAGLTFQFVNLLDQKYCMNSLDYYQAHGFNGMNAGGWGACELRGKMNPGGEIWNMVPVDLQKEIAQVNKAYGSDRSATSSAVNYSQDYLFLASYRELVDSVRTDGHYEGRGWMSAEGYQYEYWTGKVSLWDGPNPSLIKHPQSNSEATHWWERTVTPYFIHSFMLVHIEQGVPSGLSEARVLNGVCPCFCL